MKKTVFALVASLALVLCSHGLARAEKAFIVQLEGAPLKILVYSTKFNTKADKTRVHHEVKYQNSAKLEVKSARFGILECNGYDERIDGFGGYTLEESSPGEKDSAEFINEAPHAAFFKRYGTGYIWVDSVRFADGTIWKADRAQLLEEMKKYKPEITAVELAEKKSLQAD